MATAVFPATRRGSNELLEVTPDIACQQILIVNVCYVGAPGVGDQSWVLVDAGLSGSARRIRETAEERFGPGARPSAIILTHGHFDHVGAVTELSQYWDTPVYAHALEMPYLTGQSAYPPPDPAVGGGAMAFLSRFFPRGPIQLNGRVRPLPPDGSVPEMPGWRWIHTPGHSPGHVSLFRHADRTLIVGDAFVTVRQESALAVLTQRRQVWRPPAYYTTDWQAARRSVQELAKLQPEVAVTGHGLPMRGERLRQGLQELANDFDRVALPSRGRYVRAPAVSNERGVVSVPPPVPDPSVRILAGLGIAAALGGVLLRKRSRGRSALQ